MCLLVVGFSVVPVMQASPAAQTSFQWGWQVAAGVVQSTGSIDGVGAAARLNHPTDLVVAPGTNLAYFIDNTNAIRVFDADTSEVSTIVPPGTSSLIAPYSIAATSLGEVYVSDRSPANDLKARIFRVDPDGTVTLLTDDLNKDDVDPPPSLAISGSELFTISLLPVGGSQAYPHLVTVDASSGAISSKGPIDASDATSETEELISLGGGNLIALHRSSSLSDIHPQARHLLAYSGGAWRVQDVIGTFPKAGGGGTFQLGIRIAPKGDGTFDLVTLLTKQ
jgi:hypothetical protein